MPAEKPKSDNPERASRILDAAERLMSRFGYDKTTISDIANEANISKGAVYLHFTSKEDLFDALFRRETLRYTDIWLRLMDADPNGGTFAGIFKNTLYALQQSPLMQTLFKRDKHALGAYMRRDLARYDMSTGVELLKALQQVGAVRDDIAPDVVSHIMNMMSYGLVTIDDIVPASTIPPIEAVIEGMGELLDRALTPADGGNSEAGKDVIRTIMEQVKQQLRG